MVILRIVKVFTVADERHQKITVHAFIVMKRHERESEESQKRADKQDRQGCYSPGALGDLRRGIDSADRVRIICRRAIFLFLSARLCRDDIHLPS